MAKTISNKNEVVEKAIARLFGQANKTVAKRKWSPAMYASLICYVAEAFGAKFPADEKKDAEGKVIGGSRHGFKAAMQDSDFSFSSNFKKYAVERGFLPKSEETEEANLE